MAIDMLILEFQFFFFTILFYFSNVSTFVLVRKVFIALQFANAIFNFHSIASNIRIIKLEYKRIMRRECKSGGISRKDKNEYEIVRLYKCNGYKSIHAS